MRSKNFKGSKCVKMKLRKSEEVVRTFDNIQTAYAQMMDYAFLECSDVPISSKTAPGLFDAESNIPKNSIPRKCKHTSEALWKATTRYGAKCDTVKT